MAAEERPAERPAGVPGGAGDAGAGDLAACADLLRAGDPARYRAAMVAPDPGPLIALYALNLELARAAWRPGEPLLAQMRLQYWHDQLAGALAGRAVDANPVLRALAPLAGAGRLEPDLLLGIVRARQDELAPDHPADPQALARYLDATAGALMVLAGGLLKGRLLEGGAPRAALLRLGRAQGWAAWFQAVPALQAAGRPALPPGLDIAAQATAALADLDAARPLIRPLARPLRPALITVAEARPLLTRARRSPDRVTSGKLTRPEFRIRARALAVSLGARI